MYDNQWSIEHVHAEKFFDVVFELRQLLHHVELNEAKSPYEHPSNGQVEV